MLSAAYVIPATTSRRGVNQKPSIAGTSEITSCASQGKPDEHTNNHQCLKVRVMLDPLF